MQSHKKSDVLIIGADPTGLVLAYELANHGISVRVVDKREGPSVHSKALGIQPRTLELLEKIGVVNDFLEAGLQASGLVYHSKNKPLYFSLSDLETRYPFLLILEQSKTERILLKYFEQKGEKVEWETTLLDIIDNKALLEHENKKREIVDSKWIIGCDGDHSEIRRALKLRLKGTKLPETFLLADVIAHASLFMNCPHILLNQKRRGIIIPLPEKKKYRLIFPVSKNMGEKPNSSDLTEMLKERGYHDPFEIEKIEWFSEFQIYRRITDSLRYGSIFLLGDTAHIHSPVGGGPIIQDAINLAWKLALVIKGVGLETLLDTYEKERLPMAKQILRTTSRTIKLLKWSPRLFSWWLYFLLVNKKWHKKIIYNISELSVHYKNSFIIREMPRDREWRGPKPGQRAPDALLEDGKYFFGLLKSPNHVLLLFDEHKAFAQGIQGEYGAWIDIHVLKGKDIREKFNAGSNTVYIIRPDGYIGYRNRTFRTEEVVAYLLRLFKSSSQRNRW